MRFKCSSICLNPLGIGEGFEQTACTWYSFTTSLNPLGIGEGFEPLVIWMNVFNLCLNPLGIGEGFELKLAACVLLGSEGLNPLGIGESFEHTKLEEVVVKVLS